MLFCESYSTYISGHRMFKILPIIETADACFLDDVIHFISQPLSFIIPLAIFHIGTLLMYSLQSSPYFKISYSLSVLADIEA